MSLNHLLKVEATQRKRKRKRKRKHSHSKERTRMVVANEPLQYQEGDRKVFPDPPRYRSRPRNERTNERTDESISPASTAVPGRRLPPFAGGRPGRARPETNDRPTDPANADSGFRVLERCGILHEHEPVIIWLSFFPRSRWCVSLTTIRRAFCLTVLPPEVPQGLP